MEERPLSRGTAMLLLGAVAFAWGTSWPVTKALLAYLPPLWTTTLRSSIALIALFAISLGRRHLIFPKSGDIPAVLNVALLHMVAFSALVTFGLQFVTTGRSIVLAYTTPLWVTVGARLYLGETLTSARMIGMTLGLLGLLLLFNPLEFAWDDKHAIFGNGLVMLAALCWAVSILHVRAHRWISTPFELVPWQVLLATCVLAVLAFSFEGIPRVTWNAELILLLLYGGIVGIAIPYWATVTANRSLLATTTSLGLLGVPVIGVLCSTVALGEPLTTALLAAMALILGGIAIGTFARSERT